MTIPALVAATDEPRAPEWAALGPEAKRERLLRAAGEVFGRQGLDAPMSDVAEAAGAGVASIYRRFPSKLELLAALVVRRLDQMTEAARRADVQTGDRWQALTELLRTLVATQAADDFLGQVRAAVAGHHEVVAATQQASDALERVLAAARREGRLRSDASTLDLRLLFAATHAARRVEPEHWPRMLDLMIDALDSRRGA
jgi:AcrR family transcriptional regulator